MKIRLNFAYQNAITIALLAIFGEIFSLDNGLARKPPMGWLSWTRFMCNLDCKHFPLSCISEQLYIDVVDRFIEDGYKDAGYEYVNIDDCWSTMQRDSSNRLQADPDRFSHGIKWLADYVHSKGLKLGIYGDYGTKTCGGYPGSIDYLKIDADTFASWEVDMVKMDGCFADASRMDQGYPQFGIHLNQTGRKMVYSCSWPVYVAYQLKKEPNYTLIGQHCNMWRNYGDITVTWGAIESIMDYFDKHQDAFIQASGPGKWNDPDMLLAGNPGISVDQAKAQMAIWSIWSAPLLMSNDLRFITKAQKDVLTNKNVIAIDQDALGIMGTLVLKTNFVKVYVKPVTPVDPVSGLYSYAVAFVNLHRTSKQDASFNLYKLGLKSKGGYKVMELFTDKDYGFMNSTENFQCNINPTGVVLIKATLVIP